MTTRSSAVRGLAAAALAVTTLTGCFVRLGPPPPEPPPAPATTGAPAATTAAAPAAPSEPTEGKRVACSGQGTQELSNIVVKATDSAIITASGQCKIILKNPTIQGPIAIVASDDSEIRIQGGTVTGAISASGHANVTMKGVKTTGPFNKTGQAVINVQ